MRDFFKVKLARIYNLILKRKTISVF